MVKSSDLPIVTGILREIEEIESRARFACLRDSFAVHIDGDLYHHLGSEERQVLRELVLGNMFSRIRRASDRAKTCGFEITGYQSRDEWIAGHLASLPKNKPGGF